MSSRYRKALITGASSGIGHAVARRLARGGVELWLAARREPLLAELCEAIVADGGRAHVIALDVADADATAARTAELDREAGGFDLVVANAGMSANRRGTKLTWEHVRPTLQVNLMGAIATLLGALPAMVQRDAGRLAAVTSLAGIRGLPTSAAYSASKGAVSVFLESLRIDLRKTGVRVTDIQPGFVKTPMTEGSKHAMPFLVELDAAADVIVDGLEEGSPVIAFPWQLATLAKSARLVPSILFDAVVTRGAR